jgi:hypothetical protein
MNNLLKRWLLPPGVLELLRRGKQRWVSGRGLSAEDRLLLQQTRSLKDRHRGQRCFILGAGSSIKQQDLKLLQGEIVISVSNTFVHPDYPLFKPRYHVLPTLLYGHERLYTAERFVGWLREMEAATGGAEMFFHIGDRKMIDDAHLFHNRAIHWVDYVEWDGVAPVSLDLDRVPHIWSVSELAITVALYMGFDQIYLLGMDHDWFNGTLVYFYDHKQQHAMKPDESRIRNMGVDAEFQMRRHADIFRKYKYLYSVKNNIFNANANGKHYMDVFPKVEYETLFSDTAHRLD